MDDNLQHVRFARNAGDMTIPEGISVPWADTLCRRALDSGQMFTGDVGASRGDSAAARQLGIQTYISASVRSIDGVLLGTLCAASAATRPIPPNAAAILSLFSVLGRQFHRTRAAAGAVAGEQ